MRSMRKVTFIRGLLIEEIFAQDVVEYVDFAEPRKRVGGVVLNTKFEKKIIPVSEFRFECGTKDLYIAYSEEVERILGIPIRLLIEGAKSAEATANRLRSKIEAIKALSRWQRFKSVFTGVPDL